MVPQRIFTIPIVAFALGACSVYDASLLGPFQNGSTGGAVGSSGALGGDAQGGGTGSPSGGSGAVSGSAGSVHGAGAPNTVGDGGAAGDDAGGTDTGGTGGSPAHAGATSGGNSSGGGAGGGGGAITTGGATGVLALDLISNMEDQSAYLSGPSGRNGDWYASHDDTVPAGTQFPGAPYVMSAIPSTDSRYATSKYAAMTNGSGFTIWGAVMGFNLLLADAGGKLQTYDARAYCGLHFFARVGTGANSQVLVRVPDKNSLPDGGVCGSTANPCYVHYQVSYSLGTAWQEVSLLFSKLTRGGTTVPFDDAAIFAVEFGLPQSKPFELWVDDISFLKKPDSGVCPTTVAGVK